MPPKLDYTAVDAAIQANPELSSRELCRRFGYKCSEASICKRKQILGISGSRRGRKPELIIDRGISSAETPTMCKCPKCGKSHMMPLLWTGRGYPRKFCEYCRNHPSFEAWQCEEQDQQSTIYYRAMLAL